MLPVNASPGDSKTGKVVPKHEEVIGGMDNYKKYQMLV
jgi:hypothetical protein